MTRLPVYAFLQTLFDQNRNYFDALVPLVLPTVSGGAFDDLVKIQKQLNAQLQIEIPVHILRTVCGRAKSKGYLEQAPQASTFRLTKEGKAYLSSQEPLADVERRVNSFLVEVSNFFKTKAITLTRDQAQALVHSFIAENIDGLIDFINPKKSQLNGSGRISKKESAVFIEFLKEIQDQNPDCYGQFKELVLGSILATLLKSESSSDVVDAEQTKFKRTTIFFDTNIIFSLLGLDPTDRNTAAAELLQTLKSLGFSLKVFDFTIDELCRVLNGYVQRGNQYPSSLPVDHLYSLLRRKGWTASTVSDFIATAEDKLEALGLETAITNIDVGTYRSPHNEALRSKIAATKIADGRGLSTAHDLAAIDKIRELRKRQVRRFEHTDYIFLTSDFSLQKVALFGLSHNENGTVSEVILDRVLANILWLKNPNLNLPLNTVIATHSRDMLIDRKIWEKFYGVLDKLRKEGTLTGAHIETLFYRDNVTTLLLEFWRGDINKINEKLAMDEVEEAVQTTSAEEQKKLAEQAAVQRELFQVQTDKNQEIQAHNQKIMDIKRGVRAKATSRSKRWSAAVAIILVLALWAVEFYFLPSAYGWVLAKLPQKYAESVPLFYDGLGLTIGAVIATGIWMLRNKALPRLEHWLNKRWLKEISLAE